MARLASGIGYVAGATLAAGAAAAAAIVAFGLQAGARGWFGLTPDHPAHIGTASLFTANVRVAALGFAGAAFVASWRPARFVVDALLVVLVTINAGLVGAALGAYGGPLLTLIGAHSGLELSAAAIAGGAYLDARHSGRFIVRRQVGCAVAAALLLAAGAFLEAQGH